MYPMKILKSGIVLLLIILLIPGLDSCKIVHPYSSHGFISRENVYRDQSTADTSNISVIPRRTFSLLNC
jgi:hypothetical protein